MDGATFDAATVDMPAHDAGDTDMVDKGADHGPSGHPTSQVTGDDVVAFGVAEDVAPGVDLDASRLDDIEQELADVERALARLDEGSYGSCEVCGAEIDDATLVQRPATRFCSQHLPIALG